MHLPHGTVGRAMSIVSLVLLLFAATAGLQLLSERYAIPLPSLLVLGGVALALIPNLPRGALEPETIFLLFVPPLLYWAALTTSLRDLKRNLRPILLLAVVLVLETMVVVAAVAHALLPSLSWPMCFALGAIVSPPDAVAVTAITRRLHLPRTLLVVLEGESLINDATALVAYQLAVAAATTGQFSLPHAGLQLVLMSIGGLAVGLLTGAAIGWVRRHIGGAPAVENTVSLLSPFIAFMPADALGFSGVLSVVAAGLYLGRRGPRVISAETRLQATAMWQIVTFLLEGLIFIYIGLQLPVVVQSLDRGALRTLVLDSCLIVAAMVVFRMLWMFVGGWLPRLWRRHREQWPSWRALLFAGWAGIRGGDSLVIALALPYLNAGGGRLAGREQVIFITFMIILLTLVVQGFTLRPAIRLLGLRDGGELDGEQRRARRLVLEAAANALQEAARAPDADAAVTHELQRLLRHRLAHVDATADPDAEENGAQLPPHARLRLSMIAAERRALIDLWDRGDIGDDVLRSLQAELDHQEVLLHRRYE